ncbi:MAG: phosphotransferase [Anaerolineae bacterium]|nr:phosphotransferase [Anaerolineae bacterium]
MTTPSWLPAAHTWIDMAVTQHGRTRTGPIEQVHERPWATVLRIPTDGGDWYFKAVAPLLAHEVRLTHALATWIPDVVLPLLAIEEERGWLLTPDGRHRLREIIRADHDLGHWERALPLYAQAQMTLASHVEAMLTMGVPDRRPCHLPRLLAQLLADLPALAVESEDALTDDHGRQLDSALPCLTAICQELDAYPIPDTLHHGDLHDGNIFLWDGQPRFFDWGDASITHPFVSLRTVFVSVEISFDLPDGGAKEFAFRDAYLQPWAHLAPLADIIKAYRLAQCLAPLISALSWHRAVAPLPPESRREQGVAVHLLLREFLDGLSACC